MKSARQIKRFFCSKKCREEYNLKIRKSKCETCGKDFYCHYTIISHHKKPRFCSKKCQGKWLGNNYGFKRNKKNISYSILNN